MISLCFCELTGPRASNALHYCHLEFVIPLQFSYPAISSGVDGSTTTPTQNKNNKNTVSELGPNAAVL